jgi:hypothetical protein
MHAALAFKVRKRVPECRLLPKLTTCKAPLRVPAVATLFKSSHLRGPSAEAIHCMVGVCGLAPAA